LIKIVVAVDAGQSVHVYNCIGHTFTRPYTILQSMQRLHSQGSAWWRKCPCSLVSLSLMVFVM